eukprot:3657857-Prymnesium_polylepis.3
MQHKHAWRTYVIRAWAPCHAHAFAQSEKLVGDEASEGAGSNSFDDDAYVCIAGIYGATITFRKLNTQSLHRSCSQKTGK